LFWVFAFVLLFVLPAPAAELVLHGSELAGQEPINFFSRQSGFVAIPAGVGLVSSGPYLADGTLSQAWLLDRRIRISVVETEGPPGADPGAAAHPFAALAEQRIGNLSGDLWRAGEDRLSFTSTVADSSRTVIDESSGLPISEERNRWSVTCASPATTPMRRTPDSVRSISPPGSRPAWSSEGPSRYETCVCTVRTSSLTGLSR